MEQHGAALCCYNLDLKRQSHGMAADDSKDELLLAVPSDVSNLTDAIEEGRARCQESGRMASAGQEMTRIRHVN